MLDSLCKTFKLSLSQEIKEFLIDTFPFSKPLYAAIHTLVLRSHLDAHAPIDITTARLYLKQLMEEQQKQIITPAHIIRSVADVHGIRPDDILGKSQTHEFSFPRQIAMYLCRSKLHLSYSKIGDLFARDHSTVMTSVKQIEKGAAEKDPKICAALTEIGFKF
jgi:chromosomal replication initiator protein